MTPRVRQPLKSLSPASSTVPDAIGAPGAVGIVGCVPTTQEVKQRIEQALPGAEADVTDLTGGGDHLRAEVTYAGFAGLSRIEQHRLVYAVFGDEIGGPIHALSLKTAVPVPVGTNAPNPSEDNR